MEFLKNEELEQVQEFIEYYRTGDVETYDYMVDEIENKTNSEKLELLKQLNVTEAYDLEEFECDFEEFMNNNFANSTPLEIAHATYFGNYNPNDDFIHLNGYGNIETISKFEYDRQLEELITENRTEIIGYMIENEDFYYFAKINEFLKEAEDFYTKQKEENKKELNEFISQNVFWAFMNSQFEEGLQKFGLTNNDDDLKKLTMIPGGGYILKENYEKFSDLIEQTDKKDIEQQKNILYFAGAISYQLSNYEFTYTRDDSEALNRVGITSELLENTFIKDIIHLIENIKITWDYINN